MTEYQILFSNSFSQSLNSVIQDWQNMGLSETQIKKFIRLINKTVISLKFYPNRFSDITSLYGFSKLTRRILIGKKYAIFYRVNKNQQIVQIGSLVQQKQVKVNF